MGGGVSFGLKTYLNIKDDSLSIDKVVAENNA